MAFTPKEEDMKAAVAQFARPGEELVTVGWAAEKGTKYAPIDMQILSSMLETSFYVKTRDGKKRALRFSRFIGYPNTEIPGRIVEALQGK